jgi:hypothetical protein
MVLGAVGLGGGGTAWPLPDWFIAIAIICLFYIGLDILGTEHAITISN